MKQKKEKYVLKQTPSLSSSVTFLREYLLSSVHNTNHISLDKSGRLWLSDEFGSLVQIDLMGNQLHEIQTSGENESGGFHTVTQDGNLIVAEQDDNVINKITMDNTITEFIQTGNWEPLSIHSSRISGDIVVGMIMDGEAAKVTMYSKTGEEILNVQLDDHDQELYSFPHYITENLNGDVCVSDNYLAAVVVVDNSGQYRFSYTGQESEGFDPYGICTDILGHILVCDTYNTAVHLLDQDGQLLSLLVTEEHGLFDPLSVCVDDENNLHVGQCAMNTASVYKYLE